MTTRKPKPKVCANCGHFNATENEQGACRRYPPIMSFMVDKYQTRFPIVGADMACGEYEVRR